MDQNRYDRDLSNYEKLLDSCGSCCGTGHLYCPCIFCCCVSSPAYWIQTSQTGLLQKFGKFVGMLSPGLNFVNPCTQSIVTLDMRTRLLDPKRQPVITKDNISLSLDSSVYFRVVEPKLCAYKIGHTDEKINNTVSQMSHAAIRTVCGQHTLQQVLEDRRKIASQIQNCVQEQVQMWGIYIQFIFIKDLHLGVQTERNLASAAVNKRVSEAKIIAAKAEVQSAKMLKQASDILNSKAAMQIRYLQVLQKISQSPNLKLMFVNLQGGGK